MLTSFQTQKLTALFNLYDLNKNGIVEKADYKLVIQNLSKVLNCPPDSEGYEFLYKTNMAVWEFVEGLADEDTDRQVTIIEFLEAYDHLLSDKTLFNQIMVGFATAFITLADQNGDGKLTEDEFVAYTKGFNVSVDKAIAIFRSQDRDNNGYLTNEELHKSVDEFFYSEDIMAPGNCFFRVTTNPQDIFRQD